MKNLIMLLNSLRQEFGADGVKVYLLDENDYSIKLIKDGKVIKKISSGRKHKNNEWERTKNDTKAN